MRHVEEHSGFVAHRIGVGYVHRMAKKKIKQLRYRDLDKHVVLTEENGDRSSGTLSHLAFFARENSKIHMEIGNSRLQGTPDEFIELLDDPQST